MASSDSSNAVVVYAPGFEVKPPLKGSPRYTLTGKFFSSNYKGLVKGAIIMTLFHEPGAPIPTPYLTKAWVVFTGMHRNADARSIQMMVGKSASGLTCAMEWDVERNALPKTAFRMVVEEEENTRREGWCLRGAYVRSSPDDRGTFTLGERFQDDTFDGPLGDSRSVGAVGGLCPIS